MLILIITSILDDFTTDSKLNQLLFSSKEVIESFKDSQIDDLLYSLLHFESISIHTHSGRPQNFDNKKHWHPLRLFKLFFNCEVMSIIVQATNSFVFRINSTRNSWKTLKIQDLYHFFDCLIKLALFNQLNRRSCWGSNGILSQVSLSKNRFESILYNFHFKDRGFNSIQDNW